MKVTLKRLHILGIEGFQLAKKISLNTFLSKFILFTAHQEIDGRSDFNCLVDTFLGCCGLYNFTWK